MLFKCLFLQLQSENFGLGLNVLVFFLMPLNKDW